MAPFLFIWFSVSITDNIFCLLIVRNRANKFLDQILFQVEIKAGIGKQVCFIKMSRKITSFFNNKSKENETISDATSLAKPDSTSKDLGKLSSQKKNS